MSMTINKELPNPAALKAEFPVPGHIKEIKAARDKEIAAVFRGESDKFLVIVGPCSADNEESVCEYTRRLARVNCPLWRRSRLFWNFSSSASLQSASRFRS